MKIPVTHTVYKVCQIEKLSSAEFVRVVTETTRAFAGDPTFDFIFRSSKELAQLVDVNLRYYLKRGKVFGAFDENGVMQGISLWNEPGGKPITAKSVLTSGMLGNFCKLFFHIRPGSFYRMLKMSDCTQMHHPREEHWYLYWITAFRPGVGGALLEDAAVRFRGCDFYLENSNPDKNNHFYRKHDFEPLPQIGWHGCILLPMLRKSKVESAGNCMENGELIKKGTLADEDMEQATGGFIGAKTKICPICGRVMRVSLESSPNLTDRDIDNWICENCHYKEPFVG